MKSKLKTNSHRLLELFAISNERCKQKTMKSDKLDSQLYWKSKTWFFTFLNVYVSWIERGKILISQLSPPKFRYFTDQNGPKGQPHENEFWHFPNTKMNITNRAQKVNEGNGVICLVSFFPSWVMVLILPKIMHILQICADLSKISKSIKAIYLHPSEKPHHALSENSVLYRVSEQHFARYWGIKYQKKVLNQQNFNEIHHLETLISSKLYVIV